MTNEDYSFSHAESWAAPPGYVPPTKKVVSYDLSKLHHGFMEGEHTSDMGFPNPDSKEAMYVDQSYWFV